MLYFKLKLYFIKPKNFTFKFKTLLETLKLAFEFNTLLETLNLGFLI